MMIRVFEGFIYLFIMTMSSFSYAKSSQPVEPYALIYSGVNTCKDCPEAVADVARLANLPVKFVSDPNQIPGLLHNAVFFSIGATEDNIEQMRLLFNKKIVSSIKEYINQGGHYLGICGGAFIAAKYYMADVNLKVRGFDLVPALAVDYSESNVPHLEKVRWYQKEVTLYFQGGPKFILEKNAKNINIIARYSNGDIAALIYTYGKGKVIVIGPHPEADKTWLEADGIDATHWQPSQELAVNLIKEMQNRDQPSLSAIKQPS